ncbi:hypothetical protein HZS_3227, partial [Henneguya salminicola]
MEELERSNNHLESQLKYDSENRMINILTYQRSDSGEINETIFYYSSFVESILIPILFKLSDGPLSLRLTMIEYQQEIIVGFSKIQNFILVTSDYGKNWTLTIAPSSGIKKIVISPQYSHHIAVVDNQKNVYLIPPLENYLNFQATNGTQIMWSSSLNNLYFLGISFENEPYLLKTNDIINKPIYVLAGAIKYGEIGDILWAVTKKDGSKAKLFLILNDGQVKNTYFPDSLNPIVKYIPKPSLKDLSFVRIAENLRILYNASIEPCIAVETFDDLPGVLIINKEIMSEGYVMIFTAISYNYGTKWTHIIPPKIIQEESFVWQKVSLSYDFIRLKSFLIVIGTIYRNSVEDYFGLFLSVDAGYSWELIPSSINNVQILDYGSVLLGLPK